MSKASVGVLAIAAAAGWVAAFLYFSESGDLAGKLETSEAELAKLAEDLQEIQVDAKISNKAAGRLDLIREESKTLNDKVAAYEKLIQSKQDELVTVLDELATLETELRQRQQELPPSDPDGAKEEADPALSEAPSEPGPQPDSMPEAEVTSAEAGATELSAADPEPKSASEDNPEASSVEAGEPEPEAEGEAKAEPANLESEAAISLEADGTDPGAEATTAVASSASDAEPPSDPETEVHAADLRGQDRVAEAERRFRIVDQNGDGKVDQFEFRLNSIKLFSLIDANEDDFITIEESLTTTERFKLFDADGDGKVSSTEFTRAFATVNTDGKGYVSFDDYLQYVDHGAD